MNRRRLSVVAIATAIGAPLLTVPDVDASEESTVIVSEPAEVSPSPRSANEYWTRARMSAAQPLELVVGADGTPTPVVAPATIAQRIRRPYMNGAKRQTGTVFFKVPGGPDARCSGTAVDSDNGAVVWTAAHCVYHVPVAKFMKKWMFIPGYGSSTSDFTPYGRWKADTLGVTNQWVNSGNPKFDLGAVVVLPKNGNTLADRVGGREVAFNYATNPPLTVQAIGYPAVSPFGGNHQYRCRGTLKVGDPLLPTGGPGPVHVRCDMTGGSSGGGWRADGGANDKDVLSVTSYGYAAKPRQRYGPYQGLAAEKLFDCAQQDFSVC